MRLKQDAYQRDRVTLMLWKASIQCASCQKETMNINLELSGYIDKHRETVNSRYGAAEIFEIYEPSGRFVGFQIYLDNRLQYAPFMTLRGARATAKRILFK